MDNSKKIIFYSLFLIIILIKISSMSATPLSCVLNDKVTNLTVYLGDYNSYANFYFNTFGYPECDEINLTKLLEEYDIEVNLGNDLKINLSNVLNSYDFGFNFSEKDNKIHFNHLNISDSSLPLVKINNNTLDAKDLINTIFIILHSSGKINQSYTAQELINHPSLLDDIVNTNLIEEYDFPEMWGDLNFLKQGTIYQFNYSKGLADLNETYLNRMKDAVRNREYWELNVNEFIEDSVLPIFGFSILGKSFGNLTTNVTTGDLEIKNGTYNIPIIFDYNGEKQIKNVNLIIYSSAYSEEQDEEELKEGEQLANNKTTIVNESTDKIIFTNQSLILDTLIIPQQVDSSKEVILDMSKIVINGFVNTVLVPKQISLIRETSLVNYSVLIPENLSIKGIGWDGTLILPTLTSTTTSLGKVNTVIEVGSLDLGLIFDKPVKITLGGMTGKYAFFQNDTGSYSIDKCDLTANENSAGSLSEGECYFDDGNNLIIWTYHFTKFGAYEEESILRRRHKRTNNTVISSEEEINNPESPLINPNSNGIINLNQPKPTTAKKNNGFFGITGGAIADLFGGDGSKFFIFTSLLLMVVIVFIIFKIITKRKIKEKKEEEIDNPEEVKQEEREEPEKKVEEKPKKKKNKKE